MRLQCAAVVFERAILVVSVLATAAFVAAGAHAALVPAGEGMRLQVLLALGSAMLLVFPHLWVVIYLTGTARAVRLEVAAGRAPATALAAARGWRQRVLLPLGLATAGALGTLAAGQGVALGMLRPVHQVAVLGATLACQLWAVAAEWRSLRGNAGLLAGLERGGGAASS
jgi:hypothetical protein